MAKYLNYEGLTELVSKIKSYVTTVVSSIETEITDVAEKIASFVNAHANATNLEGSDTTLTLTTATVDSNGVATPVTKEVTLKTVNGESIFGEGDIPCAEPDAITTDEVDALFE